MEELTILQTIPVSEFVCIFFLSGPFRHACAGGCVLFEPCRSKRQFCWFPHQWRTCAKGEKVRKMFLLSTLIIHMTVNVDLCVHKVICVPRTASISETVFSEECVLSEKIPEPQRIISPPQTPPTPTPRINPPPERVQTHSYPPPELPPCGHVLMSISAISEQGVIYAMTYQAGVCCFISH